MMFTILKWTHVLCAQLLVSADSALESLQCIFKLEKMSCARLQFLNQELSEILASRENAAEGPL